jgi:N-acetylmuramoyl-L-alanine amidase
VDTIAKIKFLDAIGQPIKGLKHQLWLSGRCISENKTKENGETVLIKRPEGGIIDVRVYDDISSTYESKVKFTLKGESQNLVVHSPKVMIEGVKLSEKNVSKGDYSRNYHEVKPKETLRGIAEQYHTTVNVLMSLNNIDDPSKIYIGQKLKYPLQKSTTDEAQIQNNEKKSSSTSLTNTSTKIIIVQNGDTLSSIARTTNNSVNEIKSLNMLSTDIIRIGDKLNVYVRSANSASINTNSGQTKSIDSTSAKPKVEQKSSSNQEKSPIAEVKGESIEKKQKKIIVIDPGHGIRGDSKVSANVGTQIRLLKLEKEIKNTKLEIGKNYSWKDLTDEIINNAHQYFKYIETKDPKSPTEAEYVYERAIELKQLLEKDGHIVYLTRDTKGNISYENIPNIAICKSLKIKSKAPLSYRNTIANEAKANYFISLHCDGVENLINNYAVMCYKDENGKKLAEKIVKNYCKIKALTSKRSDLTVLKNNAKYKILIEFGFMTTPRNVKILINESKTLISDIYRTVKEHINEN